jgi:ubiquinone/menaquinone biosynthesis C-methylase UbiE
MRQFADIFEITPALRVLDVGGTYFNWSLLRQQPRLVLLNLGAPRKSLRRGEIEYVKGDGTYLPFRDGAFDIVYSNSVIEHLMTFDNQCRFATECQRVGKSYYIQTPNRWFLVEPHYLTPFIHWLPAHIRLRFLRYGTLWGLMTRPTFAECVQRIEEIRLLTESEVRALFPQAEIWYERVFGMVKSFMAVQKRGIVAE